MEQTLYGYAGSLLRIDLTERSYSRIRLDADFCRNNIGGTGFGAKLIYDEVPPGTGCFDPENKVVLASGPISGTNVSGSGTISAVFKGPMTNHAGTTQANGFFGAFLKKAGFDGLILQGKSEKPVWILIREEGVDFFNAEDLWGLETLETEKRIRHETGLGRKISVFTIGPAAEKGVRYGVLLGDQGHVASKNGIGTVLGAKNLKAIAVVRGRKETPILNPDRIREMAIELLAKSKTARTGLVHTLGTAGFVSFLANAGALPVKNYNTNLFPAHAKVNGDTLRQTMTLKRKKCWACGLNHLHFIEVPTGPYAGLSAEEPEYELVAGFGPLIGSEDLSGIVMLSDLVDRLGLDGNETAWAVAWVIDCYENGLFTNKDTDGLDMRWGNVEAVKHLIEKIARREGIGDLLAEGVMRAAEKVGGHAQDCAVYTKKGATPRMHDHRARWSEMLDTCVSTTSTLEATSGGPFPEMLGMPALKNPFDPREVGEANAKVNGWRVFEDCLGVCNFNTGGDVPYMLELMNQVTGWRIDISSMLKIGSGIVHRLRMFNLSHGFHIETEAPSARYSLRILDGPHAGKSVLPSWDEMRSTYYRQMGWDEKTGWPLPDTLRQCGLSELISDLPGA